jgi:aldehyde dehydrogenase (NAD+)
MRIAQEEVFGPVLSVITFDGRRRRGAHRQRHPLRTRRGRLDAVDRRALTMADRIRAGTVWINNYRMTSTTSPFGGFKLSGTGREGGIAGMREYLEVKSVWLSTGVEFPNPFVRR